MKKIESGVPVPPASQNRINCVFFDAVGTLIRLRAPVGTTYTRLASRFGITLDAKRAEQDFRDVFRMASPPPFSVESGAEGSERDWWRTLVAEIVRRQTSCDSPPGFAPFFDEAFAYYGTGAAWNLFPETLHVLEALRETGVGLGVILNFDRRLRGVLKEHGIDRFFEPVILSGECAAAKPDPDIFRIALERAGCTTAAESLHVGDDPEADWNGADAAGMKVFRLRRPENSLLGLIEPMPSKKN